MHLAIQQGVDKINSLQADMLLSEEIDIELNKSMSRFINTKYGHNNKYREGFEQSQKRIDDLRSLVREYEAPVTFKEQYNNSIWIDKFRLPSDYMYLVNQRSEIIHNNCDPIGYTLDDSDPIYYFVTPRSDLYTDQVTGQPRVYDAGFSGTPIGFGQEWRIMADPSDITLGSVEWGGWAAAAGLPNGHYIYPADLEQLHTDLITPSTGSHPFGAYEVYWETYGVLHHPGCYITVMNPSIFSSIVGGWLNWDSSITNAVSGVNEVTQLIGAFQDTCFGCTGTTIDWTDPSNSVTYIQYLEDATGAKRIYSGQGAARSYAFNKFVQQDDIFKLLEDPFNTTKHTSPLTTIRGQYIDIYTSDIFLIDKVKITYIRKPKEISLSLGIDCELPVHCHQEIVDMTVSSILEGINDPRYRTHQLEVSKNE